MANQIYALLVGINNYSEVQLKGCINDIRAVESWLTDTYKNAGNLHIKRLTDDDTDALPTRDNIVAAFFAHFANADNQDICLFYFAGHGINLTAPKAFTDDAGSGSVQAILCMNWQRGIAGGYIIDKELSYLIWKATIKKPGVQFIVITDCCHSGTATRSITTDEDMQVRSMDIWEDCPDVTTYLGYKDEDNGIKAYNTAADGSITVQLSPHIHIAAAQDTEEAKELRVNDPDKTKHGAFSYALLKLLGETGGKISYQLLQEEVCNLIKTLYFNPGQPNTAQQPKLNNYYRQAGYINKWFLSNDGVDTGKDAHVYYDKQYGWCIDEGLLHGVSADDAVAVTLTNAVVKSLKIAQAGLLFSVIRAQDATDTLGDMNQNVRFYPACVLAKKLLPSADAKSKWQYIVNLNNRETKLTNFTVQVDCATGFDGQDYTYETGDVNKLNTLSYIEDNQNNIHKPAFNISITNNGSTDLFFSFAYLDTNYNIDVVAMNEDQAVTDFKVAGGNSQGTKRIKLQNESDTTITEYLKIFIAANKAVPLYSIEQHAVEEVTRGLATDDDDDINHYQLDDWATVTISFQIAPKPN